MICELTERVQVSLKNILQGKNSCFASIERRIVRFVCLSDAFEDCLGHAAFDIEKGGFEGAPTTRSIFRAAHKLQENVAVYLLACSEVATSYDALTVLKVDDTLPAAFFKESVIWLIIILFNAHPSHGVTDLV
jgi:hypothetical protein